MDAGTQTFIEFVNGAGEEEFGDDHKDRSKVTDDDEISECSLV